MKLGAGEIEALFTRADGQFLFARWGRPICPVVFGVDDATLAVVKAALDAVVEVAGHAVGEVDAELGANLMMFFFEDWSELLEVSGMSRLIPDLVPLVARLDAADANQYRFFRFDKAGAIKACFVFVRMDAHLSAVPAQTLALSQIAQSMLLWSDIAFRETSPLAIAGDHVVLKPEIGALLRAAYDPVLPVSAGDRSHALRLSARMDRLQ